MDKHEVALILNEIATLLELQGGNPFKVRAYQTAARAVESLDEEIETVVQEGRLEEIPGIGERIAKKITTLVTKGALPYHQKLKVKIPTFLLELMTIPGIGPKKVNYLYKKLHITSLEELSQACQEGKVAELAGFGAKTEANILRNLKMQKEYGRRTLWWHASKIVYPLLKKLSQLKYVKKAEIAGSFRRKVETVGDLDFVVASDYPEKVMDWFTKQPSVAIVQSKGKTKSSVRLKGGIQADLRVVPEEEYACALVYFTGSKDFNIDLRKRALKMGYTLNEYGLQPLKKKNKFLSTPTEAALFKALKLDYIPPELREGHDAILAAEKGTLPTLVEPEDIRGIFHCHTTDSDGHNTLEEMAAAADEYGWKYLGISDHSKASYQANGMDEKRLFNQIERIAALNASGKHSVRLLAGLECDINSDGTLDFDNDVLKSLDFVIASVHRRYKANEKEMTARIIKAVENPYTTILGHLTGRILLHREPYAINIPKIIDACAANGKVIELNAYPSRLDMDWRLWHHASQKGVLCAINPDAHNTAELEYYHAGVNVARKGWLEKKHIINTLPLAKLLKFLQRSG